MSLRLLKSSSHDWEDNKGYCVEESFSPETYRIGSASETPAQAESDSEVLPRLAWGSGHHTDRGEGLLVQGRGVAPEDACP